MEAEHAIEQIENKETSIAAQTAHQVSLPQHDPVLNDRKRSLTAARKKFQYNHTNIPGVAMLEDLPQSEHPSMEWISLVGKNRLDLLLNQHLVEKEWRRQHWLKWYQYSLPENFVFLKNEAIHYLEYVAPKLIKSLSKDHRAQQKTLKSLLSSWRPELTRSLDDIVSAFSGLLPLLSLDRPRGRAKSVDQFRTIFQSIQLPQVADVFQDDATFGYLRVAGPNPNSLKAAKKGWNQDFPVTEKMFSAHPEFGNDSLTEAMKDKRLYILEYSLLDDVVGGNFPAGQKYISSPKALFAVPKTCRRGVPLPIAIKCSAKAKQVFTPKDGYAWEMAKNVVNVADSNYQEMVAHLSHTHLVAEAFVIATHRQLSKNHPLYALLTPHFEGTAFINWAAQEFLIADGNSVDILFAGTIESSRKLAVDALKSFDFNQQMLPEQLKQRGVLSDRLYFPYRDDGLVLWGAILAWVEDYIQLYYHSDDDIKNDAELQGWAAEISAEAGGRIKGFGEGEEGVILTRSYLSSALTMIIYTCSVQHAAVNFTQQTIMSFTPAMPLAGYAPEPKSRSQSKKAWLAQFPPLEMANQQLALMESLGVYYTRLGQYPHHQFKDPAVAPLLQQFQQELQRIEGIIRTRNAEDVAEEVLPYDTLVPSAIPQSINI